MNDVEANNININIRRRENPSYYFRHIEFVEEIK
jgi:hypothetical protein